MLNKLHWLVVTALWLLASAAGAGTWIEVGDAGDSSNSAQKVLGTGSLDEIQGLIHCCSADVDVFSIVVSPTFLAWVEVLSADGYVHNTSLFVFDDSGHSVARNGPYFQPPSLSFSPPSSFVYHLAIAPLGLEPIGGGWGGSYTAMPTMYAIHLSGAEFVSPVISASEPEIAPLMLVGLGVCVFFSRRRKPT